MSSGSLLVEPMRKISTNAAPAKRSTAATTSSTTMLLCGRGLSHVTAGTLSRQPHAIIFSGLSYCADGAMEQQATQLSPSLPMVPRGITKLSSVQIRVFGENMTVLKEFPGKVDLRIHPDSSGQRCTVSFHDGEYVRGA